MVSRARLRASLRLSAALAALTVGAPVQAGSIDTALLEGPWRRQWERHYEVGRDDVRWRQKASRREGVFAGAAFTAPAGVEEAWALATDYAELRRMAPDVEALRVLERSDARDVIEIDMKVLWKELTLRFEVERERPTTVRFRLVNPAIGEYRGVFRLKALDASTAKPPRTAVELATWLKPAVRISSGLVLWVERTVMLKGIRKFLNTCRAQSAGQAGA